MKKLIFLSLNIIIFVFPDMSFSQEIIAESDKECVNLYSMIHNATFLKFEDKEININIFETGGGDPAVNGNYILISIYEWENDGNRFTWKTGINVYKVENVFIEKEKLIIECSEHYIGNNNGKVLTRRTDYIVSPNYNEYEKLENIINIEKIIH